MPAVLTVAQLDALMHSFDWDAWVPPLEAIVTPAFIDVAVAQGAREAVAHDYPFSAKDPFLQRHFTSYLGTRITQLDDTTREIVTDELHRALEDGEADTVQALAGRLSAAVDESAAFSPSRSLMIARTETAIAYNTGALASYRQGDFDTVDVSDGDGDDECEEADGEVWSLDDALANPIAHPNCTRSFAPHVDDDE